jgi:hypothetical protein
LICPALPKFGSISREAHTTLAIAMNRARQDAAGRPASNDTIVSTSAIEEFA